MTRRLIVPTLAMALAAALATTAVARTPPQEGGPGEGMASMPGLPRTAEEVQPWAERMFTRFDANQDGAITEDELAVLDNPTVGAMGGSMIRMMILRSDADGDSRVTVEELTAGAQRMFERMTSGGGARGGMRGGLGADMLTMPRTAEAVQPWAERLFAGLDANQDGSITGDELAILANPTVAAMGGSRLRAMIVQSDASNDSRISAEELAAGARRMFDRMDRNGDGRLTDDELPRPPAPRAPIVIPPAEPASPFPDMPNGG
ncbi:MAG: EF-hand domain-containing protein [Brevundimonas sp.]|nr:EF-hand domain-containing protein [Brevundimonas sp.]